MPRLIRNRALVEDPYALLRDAGTFNDVPDGVPVIVPLALWSERRVALIARGETGVWLAPADDPFALAAEIFRRTGVSGAVGPASDATRRGR